MRWYHWALVPLIVVVVVLAYIIGRSNRDLADDIWLEIDALDARATAKRLIAKHDAEKAADEIEARYAAKMEKLRNDQKALADTLRGDPVRLADWLARL